eukprot:13910917-Alexandrium_andersonii.AAC.1
MKVCLLVTRGCASTPYCRARTRQGRTSRPGPPSTPPRCARLFSAALPLSTFVRVGVYRCFREGSWVAVGRFTTSLRALCRPSR